MYTASERPPEPIPSPVVQAMLENTLLPGELVIHVAAISPGIYWAGLATAGFAAWTFSFSLNLAVYFGGIAALLLLRSWLMRKYLLLATTSNRVIIRHGIVNQQRLDLRHSKIESIEILRTLPGMIFGYANVILAGTGQQRIMIPYIEDAESFRDNLTQKLLEREAPLPSSPYVPPRHAAGQMA
jgi:hypothetical protein